MRNLASLCLLFFPFMCGCACYSIDQYEIEVYDAENHVPVEGAKVYAYCVYAIPLNSPKPTEAITDQYGVAELQIANYYPRMMEISAEDYKTALFLFDRNRNRKNEFLVEFKSDTKAKILIYKKTDLK